MVVNPRSKHPQPPLHLLTHLLWDPTPSAPIPCAAKLQQGNPSLRPPYVMDYITQLLEAGADQSPRHERPSLNCGRMGMGMGDKVMDDQGSRIGLSVLGLLLLAAFNDAVN